MRPDVYIIGAGPAGLAAALALRRAGMSVVAADGRQPPIDKACGEGLMPAGVRALCELGVDVSGCGMPFRGISFHACGRSVEASFTGGNGRAIRRTLLHSEMLAAAQRAGVELRWGTPFRDLSSISAGWIVGADGASSRVRSCAGLDARHFERRRFAFRQHYAVAPWSDCVEVHWTAGRQIYVTPVSARETGLALISRDPHLRLDEALRSFPALRARVLNASPASSERGSVTSNLKLRRVAKGNVALVGDASGTVDAITGEGLCLAFRQAALLADAIVRGNLEPYNRAHPALARKPLLMSHAMLLLDRGVAIQHAAMGVMSWQPGIFRALLALHAA